MFRTMSARLVARRVAAATATAVNLPGHAQQLQQTNSSWTSRRFILSEGTKGMNKSIMHPDEINKAIFRRLSEKDFDSIDKIYSALMEYFNHIKFRKGWDQPKVRQDEAEPYFREAAEYIFRVRQYLDRARPGEPTLRMLDGDAQKFLHSDAAAKLVKDDPGVFVTHLVHAGLSDARGYVEGLNAEAVSLFITRLQRHRYSPAEHLRHVMLEGMETLDALNLQPPDPKKPHHYVEEGSPEDKSWRAAIDGMYSVVLAAKRAAEHRAAADAAAAGPSPPAAGKP